MELTVILETLKKILEKNNGAGSPMAAALSGLALKKVMEGNVKDK